MVDGKPRVTGCRLIPEAMDRAGLNAPEIVREHGRATIHSLRHTYASWLLAGGADLADVQGALGHTTLAMTRRYAHLSKAQTINRLSVAMSKSVAAVDLSED
jgi:site-specific recombinase XerD